MVPSALWLAWAAKSKPWSVSVEKYIGGLDLVSRDEFDAIKAMAEKARTENDALKARLDALEAKLGK
jgi:BMFP domain-containing protein YqiC